MIPSRKIKVLERATHVRMLCIVTLMVECAEMCVSSFFLGPRKKKYEIKGHYSLFLMQLLDSETTFFLKGLFFFSCLLCWWSQFSKIKASITLPRFKMLRWSRAHKTNAAISPKTASLTQFCKKFLVEKGCFGIKATLDVVIPFGKCDFDFWQNI